MPSWLNESGVFRAVFDAGPSPMLIVDPDVMILAINKPAEAYFGATPETALQRRGGDALGCVHHFEHPNGCGHAEACRACVVRNSVKTAMAGAIHRRELTRMDLRTAAGVVSFPLQVNAVGFLAENVKSVLLSLENVGMLIHLPLCAWCKKVKTGVQTWEAVESFLARKVDVYFSHSICEECMTHQFPGGVSGRNP